MAHSPSNILPGPSADRPVLSRKRTRCDSLENTGRPEKHNKAMVQSFRRDDTYYFEDGSCVLLVEDALFNVHRTVLCKDSSSFRAMFSLPPGERPVEGSSDDNPIILTGDTASDFRHFLWTLYALPSELSVVTSPAADLDQLVAIARIANKYAFKSTEIWILDAIEKYVDRKPSPIIPTSAYGVPFTHLATISPAYNPRIENAEQLTRLIRLAQMCNHERLLNTMIQLLRSLMVGSVQYAYLAMTLADELGLRALRGVAYLEVMQKAVIVRSPPVDVIHKASTNTQPSLTPDDGSGSSTLVNPSGVEDKRRISLTSQQQLRLLAGYYRLTETWEELRRTPPHFDHAVSCDATWHQHGCTQSWLEFWKEKARGDVLLGLGLADVIGRLKQISKDYDRWGSATYMHHDCRQAARRSINEVIKRVEDALPDYFSDADIAD
ncbi:hypothetical protein D9756_005040 [Leucocoprinus leucothites]|uniref:BTB domain-containing protein n=1 Tax=Leucocoprinus leucothites TaxID=201217 RepID=A0A8H5G972_9AGAR|nr:hypothetical protein D9756_005040 [Leucoagaricus leucothites]